MSAQAEAWRVSTPEGIFETDLETLKQWIAEGCVLSTDKVSKGKLGWIEAGRAPMLRAAFNGERVSKPAPPAPPPAVPAAAPPAAVPPAAIPRLDQAVPEPTTVVVNHVAATPARNLVSDANCCHNHPELAPHYVCRACTTSFCADCVKLVGSSKIPVCPACGDLCRLFAEERARA